MTFAKTLTAITHWNQFEMVLGTCLTPTLRNCLGRSRGAQCAFELVGDDQDPQPQRIIRFRFEFRNNCGSIVLRLNYEQTKDHCLS